MSALCAWISSARLMNGAISRGVPPAEPGVTIALRWDRSVTVTVTVTSRC